ncbi:MAG: metalloregulator ArsR/SmtB family transcription factor [Burkholderiaceae bacterium]
MVKLDEPILDATFGALSHAVRRATLDVLGQGPASVSGLAASHDMTLPAYMKHLRVLEDAGFIACEKTGRIVYCRLKNDPLKVASAWVAGRESLWNDRLDALARHLYHQEELSVPARARGRERKKP